MASSLTSPTNPAAFRFMNLPTELRIQIYEMCLQSPKEVTLRLPADLAEVHNYPGRTVPQVITSKDTAILRVSHEIHNEAFAVFYAANRFHYKTKATIGFWPPQFIFHLSMMRHISLEYHDTSVGTELFQQSFAPLTNGTIDCLVLQLMQHSHQLRTFNLYVAATPRFGVCRDLTISDAAASALRMLKTRLDMLSIVTYGPANYLEALREAIAPKFEWRQQDLHDWPRITMHWEPYSEIHLRLFVDLFRYDKRVRVWHTSRLGFAGTELWEETPRGKLLKESQRVF